MGFDFCHSRESGNPVCFKDFSGFPIKSGMTLESYSYH